MRTIVDEGFNYNVYYHRASGCYEIVRLWDNVSVLLQGDDAQAFSVAFECEYEEDEQDTYIDYFDEQEDLDRHYDFVDMVCSDYDEVLNWMRQCA